MTLGNGLCAREIPNETTRVEFLDGRCDTVSSHWMVVENKLPGSILVLMKNKTKEATFVPVIFEASWFSYAEWFPHDS